MAEVLDVEVRESRGKRSAKKMRHDGQIPAILYGHGQENVSLTCQVDQISTLVRRGVKVVQLQGAVSEQAFMKELQWDTWGNDVLHIDFTRVSSDEKVEISVAIELRGEAPGIREGGILEQPLHDLRIECPVVSIPEKLQLRVNELKLGDSLTVEAIELPEGATFVTNASSVVVSCVMPAEELEEEETDGGAEPEIIGRKKEDEEAE